MSIDCIYFIYSQFEA